MSVGAEGRSGDAARVLAEVRARAPASVPAVREALLAACRPVAARALSPFEAIGATLAEDVTSERPHPPTAVATLGGRALASVETVGASPYAPVAPSRLVAVAGGEPVPADCDAVVPDEAIVHDLGLALVQDPIAPGTHLLRAGADAEAGARLAAAGERVSPFLAHAVAISGGASVSVRRPRLSIHHDGSVAQATAARTLAALFGDGRCETTPAGLDDFGAAAADLHVAIGSGDPSRLDPAAEILARRGRLDGVAVSLTPCEAIAWGVVAESPALVLPGRLDDLAVAALVLVAPLLERMSGSLPADPPAPRPLARKIVSQVGFTEVALLADDARGRWVPLAVGRLPWPALMRARAFVEMTPESEGRAEGAEIAARPLPFAFSSSQGDFA